jgi:hypothetical protein
LLETLRSTLPVGQCLAKKIIENLLMGAFADAMEGSARVQRAGKKFSLMSAASTQPWNWPRLDCADENSSLAATVATFHWLERQAM